jgi:hypothetical protein
MWLIAGIVLYLSALFILLQLLRIASKSDGQMHHLSSTLTATTPPQEASHYSTPKKLKAG